MYIYIYCICILYLYVYFYCLCYLITTCAPGHQNDGFVMHTY